MNGEDGTENLRMRTKRKVKGGSLRKLMEDSSEWNHSIKKDLNHRKSHCQKDFERRHPARLYELEKLSKLHETELN